MKSSLTKWVIGTCVFLPVYVFGATFYVDASRSDDAGDGTSWTTAKKTIQAAVDLTGVSDVVLVTNGVYDTGSTVTPGYACSNRVCITKAITLRSINGPEVTSIVGAPGANGSNDVDSIRCVFMAANSVLDGFTLTNGSTMATGNWLYDVSGGGVNGYPGGTLTNCILSGNTGYNGGGANYGILNNCTVSGNRATYRGGASHVGTLNDCVVEDNTANYGGAAYHGTMNRCTLTGNTTTNQGGATYSTTLNHCLLSNNVANTGGGAYQGTLNNCTLRGNRANVYGGGARNVTLNNCILRENNAQFGGGACEGVLNNCLLFSNTATKGGATLSGTIINCTISGNLATNSGGGTSSSRLQNSIVWGNHCIDFPVRSNYYSGSLTNTCTAPMPVGGSGNIAVDPLFVDTASGNYQLQSSSPCYNAGGNEYAPTNVSLYDLAGNPRICAGTVDMGSYEINSNRYVDASRSDDSGNGLSWATAKKTIQAAVDLANDGDTVWVTNGTYDAGGMKTPDHSSTNRVCITNAISVRSMNGPEVTFIVGAAGSNGGTDRDSIRCVFMATNSILDGFTLTNGYTLASGDFTYDKEGGGANCLYGGMLTNCVIIGNTANYQGGGVYKGTLDNCRLIGNESTSHGGGAFVSTLRNCVLIENSSAYGGGSRGGTLNTCMLSGNSAVYGGGISGGVLNNGLLVGNTAAYGGGADSANLRNCIVYNNTAGEGANYYKGALNYCCTTPMPAGGSGNITNRPHLVDQSHIAEDSPCVGAGSIAYATGTDLDGDAWLNPPAIGCDQVMASSATGNLAVVISGDYSVVVEGHVLSLTAEVGGHALSNRWDFGNGVSLANGVYVSHIWSTAGVYDVVLTVYNADNTVGVSITQAVTVVQAESSTHYVWTNSPASASPYTSWTTAAHTIQEAVDVANVPGSLIRVTNGLYNTGSVATPGNAVSNRVCATNPVTIRSENGPDVTVIEGAPDIGTGGIGGRAIRGVFLGNEATLSGFTITNGYTSSVGGNGTISGGGVCCLTLASLENCELTGNAAHYFGGGAFGVTLSNCTLSGNKAMYGGGAHSCILDRCKLVGNAASSLGGGGCDSTLNNCLLSGNSAPSGGGMRAGTLNNCTLTGNAATNNGGGAYESVLRNCILWGNECVDNPASSNFYNGSLNDTCTAPLPSGGSGNIVSDPLFVDPVNSNWQLQGISPCINVGNNEYAPTNVTFYDLAGDVRIVEDVVDMGAYECQHPTAIVLYDFGLSVDQGIVSVHWVTASEVDTVGFILERQHSDGSWIRVRENMILARGSGGMGAEYAFVDAGASEGNTYRYRLTEFEVDGTQTPYEIECEARGPFEIRPVAVAGDQIILRWLSWAGETYRVLRADSAKGPYSCIADEIQATPPQNTHSESLVGRKAGFYVVQRLKN